MLTAKAKYGLKAMTYIAALPEGQPALSVEIADEHAIPKKYLDTILNELRQAGFLVSKTGRGGGYRLGRPANAIIVGDVIRTLDGPLAQVPCVSRNFYARCQDCATEDECNIRLIMLEAREAIAQVLDKKTLADMNALGHAPLDNFAAGA